MAGKNGCSGRPCGQGASSRVLRAEFAATTTLAILCLRPSRPNSRRIDFASSLPGPANHDRLLL